MHRVELELELTLVNQQELSFPLSLVDPSDPEGHSAFALLR